MGDELLARQDRGGLAAPVPAVVYDGIAARTHRPGDGLQYPTGEEYRDTAELHRMAGQIVGKPLLLLHPADGGLLKHGSTGHQVGQVIGARVDGDKLATSVLVTDPAGQSAIASGTHELSMGYECKLDSKRYQRDSEVDHLAIVPKARCGPQCSLRTDCQGCVQARLEAQGACTCNTRASRHSDLVDENEDAKLTAATRKEIPAGRFAIPGRRGMPLEDAGHVRDAMARFGEEHFQSSAERKSAYHHILARAHELGIDASHFEAEHAGRLDGDMNMDLQKQIDELKGKLQAAEAREAAEKARADVAHEAKTAAELAAREARKDANAEKARADAAETAKQAAEQAKVAAEAQASKRTDEAFDKLVNERVEVLGAATQVLPATDKDGKAIDYSKVATVDLMKQVARHVDGEDAVLDADGEPEVRVSFRGAMKRHAKARGSHAAARVAITQLRNDGAAAVQTKGTDSEDAAYQAMKSELAKRPTKK